MSKIGRRPIHLQGVSVEIEGQNVHYKGPKGSGVYSLPLPLHATINDAKLVIGIPADASRSSKVLRDVNRIWGLHHALLQNKIHGAVKEFEKKLKIIGLGYKAALKDRELILKLGYSHEINMMLPEGVSVDIDKLGQTVTVRSCDPVAAGGFASKIRMQRPPEPYKGKGIRGEHEIVRRKAGKTKAG